MLSRTVTAQWEVLAGNSFGTPCLVDADDGDDDGDGGDDGGGDDDGDDGSGVDDAEDGDIIRMATKTRVIMMIRRRMLRYSKFSKHAARIRQ